MGKEKLKSVIFTHFFLRIKIIVVFLRQNYTIWKTKPTPINIRTRQ